MDTLREEIIDANRYAEEHEKAYRAEARDRLAKANAIYDRLREQAATAVSELDELGFIQRAYGNTLLQRKAFIAAVLIEALQDCESPLAAETREIAQ